MSQPPDPSPPSFDEWVEYCFTQGMDDVDHIGEGSRSAQEERLGRYLFTDRQLLIRHLIQLAEDPAYIAERFSDKQISRAIGLFFNRSHPGLYEHLMLEDLEDIEGPPRPRCTPEDEIRLVRAISTVYTKLFDPICGGRGVDPDAEIDENAIDGWVCGLWDLGSLEMATIHPDDNPHLVEPTLGVLRTALFNCRTAACRKSALYAIREGIGWNYRDEPKIFHRDPMMVAKLQEMADCFLALPNIPEWLRKEAEYARQLYVS